MDKPFQANVPLRRKPEPKPQTELECLQQIAADIRTIRNVLTIGGAAGIFDMFKGGNPFGPKKETP